MQQPLAGDFWSFAPAGAWKGREAEKMETKVGGKDCGGTAEPFCAPPAATQDTRCVGKEKESFCLLSCINSGPGLGLGGSPHHYCSYVWSGINRSCILVLSYP